MSKTEFFKKNMPKRIRITPAGSFEFINFYGEVYSSSYGGNPGLHLSFGGVANNACYVDLYKVDKLPTSEINLMRAYLDRLKEVLGQIYSF